MKLATCMSQTNRTILIVDDEPRQRTLLTGFVESLGCQTQAVESGELALEQLEAHTIDMVLLDVRLPGISGLETLEQIRKNDPAVPVCSSLLTPIFARRWSP